MSNVSHQPASTRLAAFVALASLMAGVAVIDIDARQGTTPPCAVSGTVKSKTTPLPGVSILASAGGQAVGATSTDTDGSFRLALPPGAYAIAAALTGFTPVDERIDLTAPPCATTLDLQLALAPRSPVAGPPTAPTAAGRGGSTAQATGAAARRAERFEALNVQSQDAPAAVIAAEVESGDAAARLLLPPGFSTDAPADAVAITGTMASLDRGMMNARFEAIGRGEFDPLTGEFSPGFGPGRQAGGPGLMGGRGGGRGGPGGPGGAGAPPGDFVLGGRAGRQGGYNAQMTYTVGGSVLDSSPYQLRPDSVPDEPSYTRQNFGGTVGGPVRLPGVYNGQRRTTFTFNYGGTRGDTLVDEYATVPTARMRDGDFGDLQTPLVDPDSGQPFAGNRIPADRLSATSLALLRFIPLPNVDGTAPNFHRTTTSDAASDNIALRVTHNFTPATGGRGIGRGGGPGGGGRGGRGGRAGSGTSVVLNAQLQYRRSTNEQVNVFPELGGWSRGSSLSLPVALNVAHRRQFHNVNLTYARTASDGINRYAYVEDVAGGAGITGIATDPFGWGVPSLSFSSLSSLRDTTPSRRRDARLSLAYTYTRPAARHTLRVGGDFRMDRSESRTDGSANGAYVFTGLYTASSAASRGTGVDVADFLLGLPQQATTQYGPGNVGLHGKSMSLFVQDDWRPRGNLTVNMGVRYEALWPFTERDGRMVNLDAAPDFTAVVPVFSGGTGPFTGPFPDALVALDANNVAPRVGLAWRLAPATLLRAGYGISYNAGAYSSIARQLVTQPPFAVTNRSIGTPDEPLDIRTPFVSAIPAATTNDYGIDPSYDLGLVQTWNADLSRDLRQVWHVGASYTHTRGTSLDIVRAPNRDPDGLRIEGVQPFLWVSSEGRSVLHAASFRFRRRPVRGVGGGLAYTLARSRDNASSIGGGGTAVAQDDRNLDAEWGLSSFDRRHQFSADASVELPFGPERRWLNQGGPLAAALGGWRFTTTFTWQSGTPYTPRVLGAAADVLRGTNGTLRADYDGGAIAVDDPTIDRFFNTGAFSLPAPGAFGNAPRNLIVGPRSRLLNAQLARDVRLGGTRAVTLQVNASNLLNMVNYASIDTVVNSPTFGQVVSVGPMRSVLFTARFRF